MIPHLISTLLEKNVPFPSTDIIMVTLFCFSSVFLLKIVSSFFSFVYNFNYNINNIVN